MTLSEASSVLKRALEDCAYDFGSTSYQDSCSSISVSPDYGSDRLVVVIYMNVLEPYYKREVDENIAGYIRSLIDQYDIPYHVNYTIKYTYKYS